LSSSRLASHNPQTAHQRNNPTAVIDQQQQPIKEL